jgi:hypothetical protein
MSEMNVRNMPIEVVAVKWQDGHTWVNLNVGNIPATIIEPHPPCIEAGIVYLYSTDEEKGNWDELINVTKFDEIWNGFTDDPRLVKIAEMILGWRSAEKLQPGTIIPPLNE